MTRVFERFLISRRSRVPARRGTRLPLWPLAAVAGAGLLIAAALFAGSPWAIAQGEQVRRGGTLVAAWEAEPVGLDPHKVSARSSYQVLENVLDTLVELDEEGDVIPALAERWEASADGLTWTFHLRANARFSNGRALTADDVVYTIRRLLDPDTGSGNAWRLAGVTSVSARDSRTVVLELEEARTNLLTHLAANKSMGIIASENVAAGEINTRPIGSGPFLIAEYQPGVRVVLERNPHYWRQGYPLLDRIEIRVIPDESVRRSALVSGDVDWVMALPPQDIDRLRERDDIVVDSVPAFAYWYLGVNTRRAPLDDRQVRRAIAEALNRENIVQGAVFNQAQVTQEPPPETSVWSFGYAPYSGDTERAQRLLREAGYAAGFDIELMPTTQYSESIRMAQIVQAQLAQIGIRSRIRALEWADWLETQGRGDYDIYVCSWNGLLDADDYYYAQHRTGEVFNFTGYSNPRVDELLDEGRRLTDLETRHEIYEQVNRMIVDDAPYIYAYNPLNTHAFRTYVKGFAARPDQNINFTRTWLDR